MSTYKEFLTQVLDIINYPDNKNEYIKEFEERVQLETVLNLVESLSDEKRDEIFDTFVEEKDALSKTEGILLEYFTKEQTETEFHKTLLSNIDQLLIELRSSLTDNQKDKISALLEKVLEK